MKFTSIILIIGITICRPPVSKPFKINEQCRPKAKMKSKLWGSTALITAWINMECEGDCNRHLVIKYSFFGKESYDYNDLIFVGSKRTELYTTRDGIEENNYVELAESLEPGWQQFELEVTTSTVTLWHQSERILTTTDHTFVIDTLEVTGSNVTINCPDHELWWLVNEKESTKIPLTLDNGEQEINFYSKNEIQPTITLSNSYDSVTLGWQEGHIVKYHVTSKDRQSFLPPHIKHTIIISCQPNVHMDVVCILKGKDKVISFYVRDVPKALYLSSGNGDDFIVLIKMSPPPEQTSAVTLVSESETTSLKNTKDGSHTTVSANIGILSTIIILLCGVICYYMRRLRKVSQSRDSVAEGGTTSNGFKKASSVKMKYFACNETKENDGGFMNKESTENKKTNSEVSQSSDSEDDGNTKKTGRKRGLSVKLKHSTPIGFRYGGRSMDKDSTENKRNKSEVPKPHVFRRDVESGDESEREPLYESSTETGQQQKFDETNIQSFSKFMIPDQEVDKCQCPRLGSQSCDSGVQSDTTPTGLKMFTSARVITEHVFMALAAMVAPCIKEYDRK